MSNLEAYYNGLVIQGTFEYSPEESSTWDCGGVPASLDVEIVSFDIDTVEEFTLCLPELLEDYSYETFARFDSFITIWKTLPRPIVELIWKKWHSEMISAVESAGFNEE